jgi:Glycoside hydrolase family 44
MRKRLLAIGFGVVALFTIAIVMRVNQVARRAALADDSGPSLPSAHKLGALEVARVVYDGKLGDGWQDWGWGPHDLPKEGPAKIKFAGYGGIVLRHAELLPDLGGFSFRYRAPEGWPEFLTVRLRAGAANADFPSVAVAPRHVAAAADGWREVLIDWSELNPSDLPFDSVSIAARAIVESDWVSLDKLVFTKAKGPHKPRTVPSRDVDLGITCGGPSKPISPFIYGAAVGDWESGITAQRIGGNPMTRHNWEANVANAGNDWFFENSQGGRASEWVNDGSSHSAATEIVVSMIGWVAKDSTSVGFPRSKFPKQRKFDPNRAEAGDGYASDGKPLKPGPPTETSVAAPPEAITRWVRSLPLKAGARGVWTYILDNEPSLWNVNHRDVHPEPLGYDELLDRTIRYATAIREADPQALIAGPAEWGWIGYLYSAKDGGKNGPDRQAHGDVPLVPWYLKQLAEREKTTGKHLLDTLDLHFYPAADGLYGQNARVDADGAALRIRATRALWDPTYRDESWIKEPIRLIPRMKAWVAENYPGLKVSIGEWSFGADEHISGAIATAEALGRFGQQGLDSAFYWGGPKKGTATFWAFRAFRNFDGKGSSFLDFSLPTREADAVSVFASSDRSGEHLVAVLLNRDPQFAINARVNMSGCGTVVSRRVFTYAAGSAALQETPKAASVSAGSPLALAPYSITVLDLKLDRP